MELLINVEITIPHVVIFPFLTQKFFDKMNDNEPECNGHLRQYRGFSTILYVWEY